MKTEKIMNGIYRAFSKTHTADIQYQHSRKEWMLDVYPNDEPEKCIYSEDFDTKRSALNYFTQNYNHDINTTC